MPVQAFEVTSQGDGEYEPQYEITSDTTDHVAAHKGSALHKVDCGAPGSCVPRGRTQRHRTGAGAWMP